MEGIETDLSTSVTQINGNLLVSLTNEMTDTKIDEITDLITTRAYKTDVDGTVLNFSAVTVMDSYTFTAFEKISKALMLMGVRVIWVGLSPGVVSALMDLNIELRFCAIHTAIDLDTGLKLLSDFRSDRKGANPDEGKSCDVQ